jgi:hypothetical protein
MVTTKMSPTLAKKKMDAAFLSAQNHAVKTIVRSGVENAGRMTDISNHGSATFFMFLKDYKRTEIDQGGYDITYDHEAKAQRCPLAKTIDRLGARKR